MIVYDYKCHICMTIEERFVKRANQDAQTCDECGCLLHRVKVYAVPAIGALFDKKVTVGPNTFDSNQQMRDFFRKNPDRVPVSKTDKRYTDMMDEVKEGAERHAKGKGFGSYGAFIEHSKKTKDEREARRAFKQKAAREARRLIQAGKDPKPAQDLVRNSDGSKL